MRRIQKKVNKNGSFHIKQGRNLIPIALILLFTFAYAIDYKELWHLPKILARVKVGYVFCAMGTMFFFFLCQSVIVQKLLNGFGYQIKWKQTYRYTLIDYYFSSITPGASGGQPSEIYFMKKDGIPIGVSSLVMLIFNGLYHLAVIIVIAFFGFGKVKNILGDGSLYYHLFIIGMLIQSLLVMVFFVLIFSKKTIRRLVFGALKCLRRFDFKNIHRWEKKAEDILDEYGKGSKWISNHKMIILQVLPIAVLHISLLYGISFWIAKAFGVEGLSMGEMIAYQGLYTMTFESLPLPGGVGLAETGFLQIFKPIYGTHTLTAALLLTRGVTYYAYLLIGGAVTFISNKAPSIQNRAREIEGAVISRRVSQDKQIS